MSVNKHKSNKVEEINEPTLRYIAEYSDMNKDDLIEFIERQLTPRSQSDSWDETFRFINETFESVINRLFKKDAAVTTIHQYPQLFKSGYSKDYFSEIQQALCKDNWLCHLLGEDINKNTPEQIVQIMQAINEGTDRSRWQNRVDPFAVAVLITKLEAKEFCGCSE
jgi:hypothetical protein